ncbi:arrestin domain-containing protein 2-like [Liolophura sinensis]|uniref:arrestin domain-containing protein 2-like n=1 Tax=Liolophura sinensis TaxID=3198878 RepID=UPI003159820C
MTAPFVTFNLQQAEAVFQGGSRIRGALCLVLTSPILVAGVEVRFHGTARASWREVVYSGTKSTEVEHEKEEIYFDDRFCLWGKVSQQIGWETREVLPAGKHSFPFQYRLPSNVPCSFEGIDGWVRYRMQGLVIRPDGEHLCTENLFTVLRELDLRKESLREMLEDHAERTVRGACCRPGRISCSVSLPKRFYVPGEALCVTANVDNVSVKRCGQCSLQIKQLVTYGGVHRYTVTMATSKLADTIRPGLCRKWKDDSLVVPPSCPSVVDTNQLITIAYCVSLEVSFPDSDLYAAVPILVTSVPDYSLGFASWTYELSGPCLPECRQSCSEPSKKHVTANGTGNGQGKFCPKYKAYRLEREKSMVVNLVQSPGVVRRESFTARGRENPVDNSDECAILIGRSDHAESRA